MHVQETNNMLNLAKLQGKLERTVFEQIDTSQNWDKASANLTALHSQVMEYFQSVVKRNEGQLPKSNAYWVLFLNSAAKLTYFYHLTKQHTSEVLDEQATARIVQGYVVASKLLPHNLSEDNEEFLTEIQSSIAQLDTTVTIPHVNNQVTDCLATLKDYVQEQLS